MQCKVYAFLGILYALPRRFSTASCPSPSPQGSEVGRRVWAEWGVGRVKWLGGSRMERGWNEGWSVENVAKNWCQIKGYVMIRPYCIYSDHLCDPHDPLLGILPFPFHFSAAFSLLCPSPPFYISTAQYLLSCSEKDVRGRKCGEEWAGMESRERELHDAGVMGRITMKGWGVGRHERQMDGEKQHIHSIDASGSSWLRSYLSSRFFSRLLWSSVQVVFSSSIFRICLQRSKL